MENLQIVSISCCCSKDSSAFKINFIVKAERKFIEQQTMQLMSACNALSAPCSIINLARRARRKVSHSSILLQLGNPGRKRPSFAKLSHRTNELSVRQMLSSHGKVKKILHYESSLHAQSGILIKALKLPPKARLSLAHKRPVENWKQRGY